MKFKIDINSSCHSQPQADRKRVRFIRFRQEFVNKFCSGIGNYMKIKIVTIEHH